VAEQRSSGLTPEEAENAFFNEQLVVRNDIRHSRRDRRYYALGQTSAGCYAKHENEAGA
jgi:uncharacterized DUF497 family protein